MKILFVCTGNTCRSPMAEGFMNKLFNETNSDSFAISRGLMVSPGSVVSANSVEVMKEYGVDISSHIPLSVTADDIQNADVVLTMTSQHSDIIKNALPQFESKVYSLGSYIAQGDVPDPYGGNTEIYKHCASDLKNMIDSLFKKINYENSI